MADPKHYLKARVVVGNIKCVTLRLCCFGVVFYSVVVAFCDTLSSVILTVCVCVCVFVVILGIHPSLSLSLSLAFSTSMSLSSSLFLRS